MNARTAPSRGVADARRIKRRLAVAAPGAVLLLAAGISVGGHAGALLAAWDRPMGYVDPAALRSPPRETTLRRATVDEFLPPGEEGLEAGMELEHDAADEPDPSELTRDLLEDVPIPDRVIELEVRMRELAERPPEEAMSEVSLDLPAFELDESVLAELAGGRPADMAYGEASGFEGQRATLGGTEEGRLRARDLLGDAGRADGREDAGGDGEGEGGADEGNGNGAGGAGVLDRSPGGRTGFDPELLLPGSVRGGDATNAKPPDPEPLLSLPELDEEAAEPEPLDEDFDYTLTRYRPAPGWFNREVGDGYFRIDAIPRRSLQKLEAMPKDVVFLVDTSSSLPQQWVDAAIRGVEASLASLNEGDRFNVVLFNEAPRLLSDREPIPANRESIERAKKFLRQAESRGYTDVNAALRRLLVRDRDRKRVSYLVLISDGRPTRGVMDTRELINLITRDNNLAASIYCVGVGEKQDRELLDFLAYRNKGRSVFVDELDRTRIVIADLLSKLRYPLIRGASFSVLGVDAERVYPKALPNIHQGQRLSIFGRYEKLTTLTMRITGMGFEGPVDFLFSLDLAKAREGEPSLAGDWAKWKLHHLYDRVLREGRTEELVREIRRIEREYDLRTLY